MIILLCFIFGSFLCRAEEFGSLIYVDSNLGQRNIIFEKIDGFAIVEGDIILKKIPTKSTQRAAVINKLGGGNWLKRELAFRLSNNLSKVNKLAVLRAMAVWEQHTKIRFIEINAENDKYFPDYLLFVPSSTNTSSSFVGRQGGEQIIQIARNCKVMNAAHEIGHALGLWHEQSRADRDNFITILWENIDYNHLFNFNQHLTDEIDIGDYDYDSIMHYTAYAFSANGKKTIIPKDPNAKIGQRTHLSEKDIDAINAIYH